MTNHATPVRQAVCVVAAAAALITGCSSSGGGGGVSQSDLVAKLNKDPQIKQLESQAGSAAGKVKSIVPCIASALKKDANQADLKKYVDGKLNLADLGGKSKGSAKQAQTDAANCAKAKVGSSTP